LEPFDINAFVFRSSNIPTKSAQISTEKKTYSVFENTEKSVETMFDDFASIVNKHLKEMKSKITVRNQTQKDSDDEQASENKHQSEKKYIEKEFIPVMISLTY
jgi:hypothetical protein